MLRLAAGVGVVGLGLFALGMRNPLRPQDRRAVRRVFAPGNIVGGLVLAALGAGVLWLFYNVVNVMPRIVVIGAILAIPAGLLVAAQIFENACSACGARLRSARPGERAVEYCPGCGTVAVVFEKDGPVVLRGDAARALVEEAKASAPPAKEGAPAARTPPAAPRAPPPATARTAVTRRPPPPAPVARRAPAAARRAGDAPAAPVAGTTRARPTSRRASSACCSGAWPRGTGSTRCGAGPRSSGSGKRAPPRGPPGSTGPSRRRGCSG